MPKPRRPISLKTVKKIKHEGYGCAHRTSQCETASLIVLNESCAMSRELSGRVYERLACSLSTRRDARAERDVGVVGRERRAVIATRVGRLEGLEQVASGWRGAR